MVVTEGTPRASVDLPLGESYRYVVVIGALVVQLCLGSIYAWSIFQTALKSAPYGWSGLVVFQDLLTQLPFAAGLASFAITMVIAGRWQDRVGPTKVALAGGVLLGLGYIMGSMVGYSPANPAPPGYVDGQQMVSFLWIVLTYGIIGGAGIGLAYVCPIAALVKWFPDKKGLITGVAVAGFGAGALIFAQVEDLLIRITDVNPVTLQPANNIGFALLVLGVVYLVAVVGGSQLLRNPPKGWLPEGYAPPPAVVSGTELDMNWRQMLRTPQFYLLWIMFCFAATAGLMTIGNVKSFLLSTYPSTLPQYGLPYDPAVASGIALLAPAVVGVMSIFNAAGRIVWGLVSDLLGRAITMMLMFSILGVTMVLFGFMGFFTPSIPLLGVFLITVGASVIGFCFGGNFALFPSTTADFFGTKYVGLNYGFVFTAYGVAGILGALIAGSLVGFFGGLYVVPFVLSGILAFMAVILALVTILLLRRITTARKAASDSS